MVWIGGSFTKSGFDPGTLVHTQELDPDDFVIGQWNEVDVVPAVQIDNNQELWFGIKCVIGSGTPATCDAGPRVPAKGDMVYFWGEWGEIFSYESDFDINWSIKGYIEDQEPDYLFPNIIQDLTITPNNDDVTLNLNWTNPSTTADGSTLSSIDSIIIYRNGSYLTSVKNTSPGENVSWTDDQIYESGLYNYKLYCANQYGKSFPVRDTSEVGTYCDVTVVMTDVFGDG